MLEGFFSKTQSFKNPSLTFFEERREGIYLSEEGKCPSITILLVWNAGLFFLFFSVLCYLRAHQKVEQ